MPEWLLKPTCEFRLPERRRNRIASGESGPVSNVARLLWWSSVRASMRVMHRLEIAGRENLPAQPSFIMVSNHSSHLDALVLGSVLPLRLRNQLYPVAAGDVFFQSPARAALSAMVLNALPIWRKRCGAEAIRGLRNRLLERPGVYILFPEGGRSRDGAIHPFKAGIGMLTAGTEIPVVPCHLCGTFEAFPPEHCVPRPGKIHLKIGAPRAFASTMNCRRGWDAIAAVLEEDVRALG